MTTTNGDSLEKDFSHHNEHLDGDDRDGALRRIRTAGSISISPELFEKIYLAPQNRVSGDLRKTFANPTPLALLGFLLSLTPLSCDLMGWRGAGGNGAASTGSFIWFGGVLMLAGSFGEFILGNTFPFVVFGSFGAFWLALASTLIPWFNTYGAYATDPKLVAAWGSNPGNPAGLATPSYNASFGFFLVFMGLLCFIYLICSLRTNIAFVVIFLSLVCAFACLAGAYWNLALVYENPENAASLSRAMKCQKAGGAFGFVVSVTGWYLFAAIMLTSVDMPFSLPVGDLSHIIKGASERSRVTASGAA